MNLESIAGEQAAPRRALPAPRELEAIRSQLTQLERQARTLIRQQPVVAVLAAASVGYLLARIVVRGTR